MQLGTPLLRTASLVSRQRPLFGGYRRIFRWIDPKCLSPGCSIAKPCVASMRSSLGVRTGSERAPLSVGAAVANCAPHRRAFCRCDSCSIAEALSAREGERWLVRPDRIVAAIGTPEALQAGFLRRLGVDSEVL